MRAFHIVQVDVPCVSGYADGQTNYRWRLDPDGVSAQRCRLHKLEDDANRAASTVSSRVPSTDGAWSSSTVVCQQHRGGPAQVYVRVSAVDEGVATTVSGALLQELMEDCWYLRVRLHSC